MKIILLLILLVSNIAFAKTKHYGPSTIEGAKIESEMAYYGPVMIMSSEIKKDIEIYGSLNMTDCKVFGKLEVTGPINTTNTAFEKDVAIKGPIFASNSMFKKNVKMHTNAARFENSKVLGKLSISSKKSPYVCLQGGAELSKVEFRENKGKVYITDKNSKVSKTNVINGEVVTADCPEK